MNRNLKALVSCNLFVVLISEHCNIVNLEGEGSSKKVHESDADRTHFAVVIDPRDESGTVLVLGVTLVRQNQLRERNLNLEREKAILRHGSKTMNTQKL